MYKVLIVDDEVLLRVGLKTTIDWEHAGFTVVAEAANGEQGYEQYQKHKPDVVITDIKMPKRDGLWLVEKIRKENQHVSILVLTCHDEFTFARNALKVGADDYILKSEVEDEELLKIMEAVKKKLDKQNKDRDISKTASTNKNDIRRALFNDLEKAEYEIDDDLGKRCKLIGFPTKDTRFAFVCVSIGTGMDNSDNERQIDQAVINLWFNMLEDHEIEFLYGQKNRRYMFLMSSPSLDEARIKRIFSGANHGAQQYFDSSIQVIYTNEFTNSKSLTEKYKDFLSKTEVLFYYEEKESYIENTRKIQFNELNSYDLKKKYSQLLLVDYIMQDNLENAQEFVAELYRYFKNKKANPNSVKLFVSELVGNVFHHFSNIYEDSTIASHEDVHYQILNADLLKKVCNLFRDLISDFMREMHHYMQRNSKLLSSQAERFIEEHFDEKISLKDVAENLNLSKHYLCNIFKKETGDNMSHYINALRIEKAKRLLLQDKKIKEVFEEVGYSNQQYFSKVFKKFTGMTVLEFKDKANRS